jgi:uncharacterized membrane protein YjgN (DUF898 family)
MDLNKHATDVAPFEFRGRTGEWFGIWITNLLLTVITAGIYSAWAKVRTKKYFYQNTYVAGRNFDYHATGLQILIGRLIFIAGVVVYSLLSAIPVVGLLLIIGLLFLMSVLLVRSLRFNAVMSSWSNVRFGFEGKAGQAFLVFLLYPFLTVFTFYLAMPFADRARRRFVASNHRLGNAMFSFESGIGPFYLAFLAAIGWIAVISIVFLSLSGPAIMAFLNNPQVLEQDAIASASLLFGFYAFLFLAFFPAATVYQAFIRNTIFNNTQLDDKHKFQSDVNPLMLVWIAVSNALIVICTLGLMLPWAHIRVARYNAAHTQLVPGGSLDDFVGDMEAQAGALGDAYTDIEAVDIGLPI